MAKSSNKNATKSLVMLIVTGVVLVAVTLCWFALNKKISVSEQTAVVENNSSSQGKLYRGITKDDTIAIDRESLDGYEAINDEIIRLENIVPGAEYFYAAYFNDCSKDYWLSLTFMNVNDGGLSDKITIYCDTVKTSRDNPEREEGYAEVEAQGQLINSDSITIYEKQVVSKSSYIMYFSFKFADDATIGGEAVDANGTTSVDYRNKTINIGSVEAVLSSTKNPNDEQTTVEETTVEETTIVEETTVEETTIEETTSETDNENS